MTWNTKSPAHLNNTQRLLKRSIKNKQPFANWPAKVWVFITQMVEHCSANAEAMRSNPVVFFFRVYLPLLKLQLPLRRSCLHLKICISAVHIIFIASLFLSRVKMNSTNWPAPNAWAFIAQMVMHFSTNAEAICSNPVEVPKFYFGFICNWLNCNYHCDDHIFI